jgi:predicted anti-sigma-YlaC factor YlaD
VSCAAYRDSISSRIDGELVTVGDAELDAHLATCAECREFERNAFVLRRRALRAVGTPANDQLWDRVINALEPDRSTSPEARTLRVALAVVAVVQLAAAIPQLLAGHGTGLSAHAARHAGSFSAALAVGFVYSALRPRRLGGFLPVVAALSICLVITACIDVFTGRTPIFSETSHLLEVMGLVLLGLLWRLERPQHRPRRE